MNKIILISIAIAMISGVTGCRKFVEVGPPKTEVVSSEAFKEDASATSAVLGIYINMLNDRAFINSGITINTSLAADETVDLTNSADGLQFMQNKLQSTNDEINSMWTNAYQNQVLITTCIEGLEKSTTLSAAVKNQLLGECRFNRAFLNFYLVNLWGNVPLITSTDYRVNAVIQQSPADSVYSSIISDLQNAQQLLQPDYPTSERVRPNKWTATALLARTYLYRKMYSEAAAAAAAVIESGQYGPLPALNDAFLKGSAEAIWQLMPSPNIVITTYEGYQFIGDISYGASPNYALRGQLIQSFEPGDKRAEDWVNTVTYNDSVYSYPYKYKDIGTYNVPPTEYYIMFRLAEQYLIRAEANAQLNELPAAAADVDIIRQRAGLGKLIVTNQAQLLTAIDNENRHEFFTEWGHRWLDLKRNGQANTVLPALKPGWKPTAVLFPLPQTELNLNKHLVQNTGY